ncbi:DUF1489 domain-containing protein [Sphingomonas sp. BT-65]|uniref:DUF1489 family protein n=1 Tax=Sphingomonas sp. BT-65 TaxID=2989821 RepID=UPI0022365EFC|nr:DUF1489 domain-containing protein [Sphingomonas sp. BT-65]MCW4462373.1 DUF1489 domain-containing protein [Sphingomonas sp. BT-65]
MGSVPLHLTKVAYGCDSIDYLRERLALRAAHGPTAFLTTRYLPKRHAEIAPETGDDGSLFWIIKHQLVGRSPILKFGEAEGGRVAIHLAPELILVQPRPKRAHQGWRYLEGKDAPADLGTGDTASLPPELAGKLAELGIV